MLARKLGGEVRGGKNSQGEREKCWQGGLVAGERRDDRGGRINECRKKSEENKGNAERGEKGECMQAEREGE